MTTLPAPGAPDVAYLLDLPGLVHRFHHACRGDVSAAVRGTVSAIRRVASEQRPAYLAVTVECPRPGGPVTWRHEFYPAYKANRPPKTPELLELEARVRAIVEAMAIPVLEAPGFEADDAIAAGCARAAAQGRRETRPAGRQPAPLVGDKKHLSGTSLAAPPAAVVGSLPMLDAPPAMLDSVVGALLHLLASPGRQHPPSSVVVGTWRKSPHSSTATSPTFFC